MKNIQHTKRLTIMIIGYDHLMTCRHEWTAWIKNEYIYIIFYCSDFECSKEREYIIGVYIIEIVYILHLQMMLKWEIQHIKC